ncbi:ComF family protein [Bacteroides sp. 51]|uniref:ComF family protein n=1 Tax=Bacteroides sp. 51 TaxID=2302938 RepID=UPI0013D7C2EC|nr:ComF family protein [Bacteroides sp. 51]NDV82093.1 ComF family protein [Bacteroides sp. 51]
MRNWMESFFNLLIPRQCVVCSRTLSHAERCMCTLCNINIPRTHYHLQKDNQMEKQFWGQIPIERVTAFFYYRKGSAYRNIIRVLKYKGRKDVGEIMGKHFAQEIMGSGFLDCIDLIIPIPLHHKRFKKRGYNQSEWIARGIAGVCQIPINNQAIIRKAYTDSQTSNSVTERWENVKDAFELQQTEGLTGKHILLIDDVLTTGATIKACASVLSDIEGVRFSIITLGVSG